MVKYQRQTTSPSLGASGCISGLITNFALMFPRATIHVFIVPVPAWLCVTGLATYDLYTCYRGRGMIDAAGHLGGGMGGILYYFLNR